MWVHDLRDADESCGGKAVGLAKLIAAGLDVPPGFVIADAAFRAIAGELAPAAAHAVGHTLARAAEAIATAVIPPDLEREVRERVTELGSTLAVRSSATIEDGAAGSAAGVFSSRTAVPLDQLWDAIRAVWTSALTPLAATYARRRGGTIAIGVIVQEYVAGAPIVVYTRPPGQPDSSELLLQRAGHVSRHARDDLPREIEAQAAALLALRAEHALGVPAGVDVELVQVRKQSGFDVAIETAIVQARPIVHPVSRSTLAPPPPMILAPLQDGRVWRWDVAHNPDPLSAAQQGLVERVEAARIAPYSLRVCGGFLYSASNAAPPIAAPGSCAELQARAVELEARLEQIVCVDEPLAITEAVERYLAFYAIWARELAPLIGAAKAILPDALHRHGVATPELVAARTVGQRRSAVEACLFAAARGELDEADVIRHLGVLSPSWDVAVETYGERPAVICDAIARARRAIEAHPPEPHAAPDESTAGEPTFAREVAIAREAAELAERDDMLFARAQWLVRRALLAHARTLGIGADDIFWLPLAEIASAPTIDPIEARRRAAGARSATARANGWRMPLVLAPASITDEHANAERGTSDSIGAAGDATSDSRMTLRGIGTGPRVAGRVVRFASLASAVAVGSGDIVVARSITPALAVMVAGCAAIVSETGGYLDHGAALARELGIPCVVGCRGAWTLLADGMLVHVDGTAGTVSLT
jgi:pyruvate,water dikinase